MTRRHNLRHPHGAANRSRRNLLIAGTGLLLGGAGLAAAAGWRAKDAAAKTPHATKLPKEVPVSPPWTLAQVDATRLVTTDVEWHAWAVMDQRSGTIVGSEHASEASRTCSVIKVWLAADFLRQAAERGQQPSEARLAQLSKMIRDSDNAIATQIFSELGGQPSFQRLHQICKLAEYTPNDSWGQAAMSARDMCRLATATATGVAAGPQWTPWLLDEMRNVREGLWGVRTHMTPEQAAQTPIKNGWDTTQATKTWNLNNLVAAAGWSMAVMVRYPIGHPEGQKYGELKVNEISGQLLKHSELQPLFTRP